MSMARRTVDRGRYGSGVSGFTGQVRALPVHALVRPGPDQTYADGDDATWMTVDWPAITRPVTVLGRRMNVVDTGGAAAERRHRAAAGAPALTAPAAAAAGDAR